MEMAAFQLQKTGEGFDPRKAVEAHLAWRGRLLAVIRGRSAEVLDPEVVCKDDACALGQWIFGPQAPHHRPSFGSLKEKHKAFHLCACHILRHTQAKETQQAESKLTGELTTLTQDLVRLIGEATA